MLRHMLGLLWSMYVDDGSLTDLHASKGSGQELVHVAFEELGTPLATEFPKHTPMLAQSDFLCIGHDTSPLVAGGYVEFWP